MSVVGRSASSFVLGHISGSFVRGAVREFVGCGRFTQSLWVATIKVGGSGKVSVLAGATNWVGSLRSQSASSGVVASPINQ